MKWLKKEKQPKEKKRDKGEVKLLFFNMDVNILIYGIENKLNSIKRDLKEIEKAFIELKNSNNKEGIKNGNN